MVPVTAGQDPGPFPTAPSPVEEGAPAAAMMMEAEAAVAVAGLMPPAAPLQSPAAAAQPVTTPPTLLTPLRDVRSLKLNTLVNVVAAAFRVGPLQGKGVDGRSFRIVELVDESWGTRTPLTLWDELAEGVGAALAAEHGKLAAEPGSPAPVLVALDLCVTAPKTGGPGGRALCSIGSSRVIFSLGDGPDLGPDVVDRAKSLWACKLQGLTRGRARSPSPAPST